jgi:hypothetical protein
LKKVCQICSVSLPNRWSVGKVETVDGVERYYCHLHANGDFRKKMTVKTDNKEKGDAMAENEGAAASENDREIARSASGELARKAWTECSALAMKLGGGVKSLWSRIHPDRSPETMLAALDGDLAENRRRLDETKPALDGVYRQIVAKKKEYQAAAPVRQRLIKIELQTLMARYKALEREFTILSENERSIETVRGRFLEVLAHGMRGALGVDMVDRLTDDIESNVDEAEEVQDALGDLERAGRRTERGDGDFDAELALFDGDGAFAEDFENNSNNKENHHDQVENDGAVAGGADALDERDGGLA